MGSLNGGWKMQSLVGWPSSNLGLRSLLLKDRENDHWWISKSSGHKEALDLQYHETYFFLLVFCLIFIFIISFIWLSPFWNCRFEVYREGYALPAIIISSSHCQSFPLHPLLRNPLPLKYGLIQQATPDVSAHLCSALCFQDPFPSPQVMAITLILRGKGQQTFL